MSVVVWANNASATLAAAITSTQTTITVNSGEGVLFPSPTSGQFFPITLISASNVSTREIAYCTSRSSDTLTVERGQESTAGLTFNQNDLINLQPTAGTLAQYGQLGAANTWAGTNVFNSASVFNGKNIAVFTVAGATLNGTAISGWANGDDWAIPTGVTRAKMRVWGGGGGGEGANGSGTSSAGFGGAGGGYGEGIFTVIPGQNYVVQVGAAGASGSDVPGVGGQGGTSSFGAFITATGGQGGDNASGVLAQGGTSTGGEINITGTPGGGFFTIPGVVAIASGGGGTFGASNTLISLSSAGNTGSFPGGGGCGASYTSISGPVPGGTGENGTIIVEW